MTDRLRKVLRTDDTLARLGGDEFVLLLTDLTDPQESQMALGRVLEVIREPIEIEAQATVVSASVGVTIYPADEADAARARRMALRSVHIRLKTDWLKGMRLPVEMSVADATM